jgi:hypothetical protein
MTSARALLVAVVALAGGCGQRDDGGAREPPASRPLPAAATPSDRGGAASAGGPGSQIIVAGSGSVDRAAAGAAAEEPGGGGGADRADADRAALLARCDRLVKHVVELTQAQVPRGPGRDQTLAQTDGLRELCVSLGVRAGDYEACVLGARTLDQVLVCDPIGDRGAAEILAQAHELAGRKDLLEQAERMIGDAGGIPEGPEGAAAPAADQPDERDLPKEHFLPELPPPSKAR